MPWNEPGSDNKDPWSKKRTDQGPPDLDELLQKLTARFGGLFGGRSGRGGVGKGGTPSPGGLIILGVIFIGWLASGFYIVRAGEAGVERRFGAYTQTTKPGPNWHFPYPIESVEIINVDEIRDAQHKATMLTQDENIVDVELAVQFRIKSAEDYLFKVRLPDPTLRQVMESAVREVVGKSEMDYILGEGRAAIAQDTQNLMQQILDAYQTGLEVLTVNMQQAQPPEQVQGAFADAIKAREDEVRFKNEAEAYENGIVPQARGEAARLEQEADAYKERVTARAEGEAARFSKLLKEYEKAPDVTRERLYLDAVESVLSNSSKVMLDVKGSNNLIYLPLDRLIKEGAVKALTPGMDRSNVTTKGSSSAGAMDNRSRRSSRLREGR
jgi:membrane protease subunit HflK